MLSVSVSALNEEDRATPRGYRELPIFVPQIHAVWHRKSFRLDEAVWKQQSRHLNTGDIAFGLRHRQEDCEALERMSGEDMSLTCTKGRKGGSSCQTVATEPKRGLPSLYQTARSLRALLRTPYQYTRSFEASCGSPTR